MTDDEIIDLSKFDTAKTADAGAYLNLRNPANMGVELKSGGNPITLHLLGRDSEVFRKASRAAQNRRLKAQSRGRNATATAEDLEADGQALIIACTIGWSNVVVDGQELEFTKENVEAFYKRFPAFFEQADEFIGARENFSKA